MTVALRALALFALVGGVSPCVAQPPVAQRPLTLQEAVVVAERFVRENGYTDAPEHELKVDLDFESIEFTGNREELLLQRKNALQPKAIGARATPWEWEIAFDYFKPLPDTCRVVTMRLDGSVIRLDHQDGFRELLLGFVAPLAEQ